jgi:hypothetical protein
MQSRITTGTTRQRRSVLAALLVAAALTAGAAPAHAGLRQTLRICYIDCGYNPSPVLPTAVPDVTLTATRTLKAVCTPVPALQQIGDPETLAVGVSCNRNSGGGVVVAATPSAAVVVGAYEVADSCPHEERAQAEALVLRPRQDPSDGYAMYGAYATSEEDCPDE